MKSEYIVQTSNKYGFGSVLVLVKADGALEAKEIAKRATYKAFRWSDVVTNGVIKASITGVMGFKEYGVIDARELSLSTVGNVTTLV